MTDTAVRPSDTDSAAEPPAPQKISHRGTHPASSIVKHVLVIAASVVMIYPLLWLVVSSLRPTEVIFRTPGLLAAPGTDTPKLLLFDFYVQNYIDGWTALSQPFSTYLVNSAIITFFSIIGNMISCALAAYAFARLKFKFRTIFFAIMLITIMLPFHVTVVPQYIMFSQLDMVNTFWPLILPNFLATDAFFVFLMVQFLRGIPRDLDEAAKIDGCGHYRIFFSIMLPLLTPALATTAIFTFIKTWNEFFGPLIYLTKSEVWTVPVALRSFLDSESSSNWGAMFAMSIVSLVPVFLVFLFGQRFLVKGISTTGIK